jgi:hypothetical protein
MPESSLLTALRHRALRRRLTYTVGVVIVILIFMLPGRLFAGVVCTAADCSGTTGMSLEMFNLFLVVMCVVLPSAFVYLVAHTAYLLKMEQRHSRLWRSIETDVIEIEEMWETEAKIKHGEYRIGDDGEFILLSSKRRK